MRRPGSSAGAAWPPGVTGSRPAVRPILTETHGGTERTALEKPGWPPLTRGAPVTSCCAGMFMGFLFSF